MNIIKHVKTIDFSQLLITRRPVCQHDGPLCLDDLSWRLFDAKVLTSDPKVSVDVKFLRTKGDYLVFAPLDPDSNDLYRVHAPELVAEFLACDITTKAFVYREKALGYLVCGGTMISMWATKRCFGSVYRWPTLSCNESDLRLATIEDFHEYRISHHPTFLLAECFEPWD